MNQRFEVTYPERRPFFIENASIFSTPEELFFSRRIVDPEFGIKLTGQVAQWGVGALVADDRAPGEVLAQGETGHGDHAYDEVFRTEREFNHQSHAGLFLSNSTFESRSTRVASVDLRYLFARNWMLNGQATTTQTEQNPGGYLAGPGYYLTLRESDNHSSLQSTYTDRSPGLNAALGYLDRTDIRRWENYGSYSWKPANRRVLSYGPGLDTILICDHEHRLQNWSATPSFSISLPNLTWITLSGTKGYELFSGIGFNETTVTASMGTSWYKWLDLNASYTQGKLPNYYSPAGVPPFLANANNASATVTIYAHTRLRLDEIYYYSRLAATQDMLPAPSLPAGDVFTNHLIRSKLNFQFTRDYSFNAILDYESLLPNNTLVSNSYSKQADVTLLFTYLPHPGTAFYMGYADTFQNVDFNAATNPECMLTRLPGTSTDRQIFAKFSYLIRF